MLENEQHGQAAPTSLPMDQAPRDGTRFYALIDGLPYLSYYDAIGRFIRVAHCSIEGRGACWEMKTINGQEWRRQIHTGAPAAYERHHLIWSKGFDFEPDGWIPCLGNVAPAPAAPEAPAEQDARARVLAALLAHKMLTHCDADGDAAALVDFLGLDGVRPGIAREEVESLANTVCASLAVQQAGGPFRSTPTLLKADTVALWHAVNWMGVVLMQWRRDGFQDAQDEAQHVDQRQRLRQAKQALRKVNRLRKEGH